METLNKISIIIILVAIILLSGYLVFQLAGH